MFSNFFKPNIAELRKKGDIAGLCKALSNKDPKVRKDAIDVFCDFASMRIDCSEAVDPLIACMKSTDISESASAIITMGHIKDVRAVKPIFLEYKKDNTDPRIAKAVHFALSSIGGDRNKNKSIQEIYEREIFPEICFRLKTALETGNEKLCDDTVDSLLKMGWDLCQDDYTNMIYYNIGRIHIRIESNGREVWEYGSIDRAEDCIQFGPKAIPVLINLFDKSTNTKIKKNVLFILDSIIKRTTDKQIIELLKDVGFDSSSIASLRISKKTDNFEKMAALKNYIEKMYSL